MLIQKLDSQAKHPKYRPKYDLENERPQKSQKVVFVIILGFVLGGKSTPKRIKIEVKIRARKSEQKEAKKWAHPVK